METRKEIHKAIPLPPLIGAVAFAGGIIRALVGARRGAGIRKADVLSAQHVVRPLRLNLPGDLHPMLRPANRREDRDGEDRVKWVQRRRMLATQVVDHGPNSPRLVIAQRGAMALSSG